MSYISGHGGSGSPLHFGSAAAGDLPGVRVEVKICELCGRSFVRAVDADMRAGRDCDRCMERARLRRAQEERELAMARSYSEPQKMMPGVSADGFPRHRARSDRAVQVRAQ